MIHKIHLTQIEQEAQKQTSSSEAILTTLKEISKKVHEEIHAAELMRIVKGEKGDKPTEDELLVLIKPLIPKPIKGEKGNPGIGLRGEKGETPNIDKIANMVQSRINLKKIAEMAATLVTIPEKEEETPDETIAKINSSKKIIDAERIRGLKDVIDTVSQMGNNMGGGGRRGDVLIYKDLTSLADGSTNTFSVTGITKILGVFSTQFPGGGFRPLTDWTYSSDTALLTLDATQVGPIQTGQTLWALCASV